jgi:methyl-accepting chemotaxis protein
MKFIDRLKFRNKLIALLIFPIAGLLFFSQAWIVVQFKVLGEMSQLSQMSELAISIGDLIHEIQKERGLTAGYLGVEGEVFASNLEVQRKNTDSGVSAFKMHEAMHPDLLEIDGLREDLEIFNKKFSRLASVRTLVQSHEVEANQTINYYSELNSSLFKVIGHLTTMSTNPDLVKSSAAYISLLNGKERAGIERAIISNTFANDEFGEGMLLKFSSLMAVQDTYFSVFENLATPGQRVFYKNKMKSDVVKKVQVMREIALNNAFTGNFGIDARDWFKVMTQKIDLLKEVEQMQTNAIRAMADDLLFSAQNALIIDFGVTFVALLAVLFFSIYIVRDIINHLGGEPAVISAAAKKIAEGNLDVHLEIDAIPGSLYSDMQGMAKNLMEDIKKVISSADDVARCSGKIQSNMIKLSADAAGQVTAADQVASSTTELSQTVIDIAQNSSDIAMSATKTMEVAEEGAQIVESTVLEVQEISETMNESSRIMSSLGERSIQIGEIIGVINDIADQTNLLALNAAIEAARAGEQGRGFAVVADEVRKLAERTSKATTEISSMISSMQGETDAAINSMKESISKIEKGTELSKQAGQALKNILERVSGLHGQVQRIASATEEMSATAEFITIDINNIAKASHSTSQGASTTTEESQYLITLSEQLKTITSHFNI